MFCIRKCFPCCFSNNDEYQPDIVKLNNISEKNKGNKKIYSYNSKIIQKLELKDSEYYIKVIDIYDGDSITGILFYRDIPTIIHIRLYGIDTPELLPKSGSENEKIKEKALAIMAKITLMKIIIDNNYILYIKTKGSEKYGRTLADIYIKHNSEISINRYLIDMNLADTYSGKTKEKKFKKFNISLSNSKKIIDIYGNKDNTFNEIYKLIYDIL